MSLSNGWVSSSTRASGFGGDKGPYRQSERRDIYKKYVKQLLDEGKAYIAFDTPEELDAKRQEIQNFQYDCHTRSQMRNSLTLPKEEVEQMITDGKQYVVRFKIDAGQEILVNDLIRGEVRVKSDILDDKVLYKSADEPAYLSFGQYCGRPLDGDLSCDSW